MKNRIYTNQLSDHIGKQVTLAGFVQTKRSQSKIIFLLIRDVTGIIQTVVLKDSKAFDTAKNITQESVVKITGKAKKEKQAPGGYEVEVETIEVLSHADPELPIPVVVEKGGEETQQTTRLDWRFIDLRKPEKLKIFKVWTSLEKGFRKYYDESSYIQLYSPSFLSTPSEGGAEVFEVPYFEKKAYLAQSPQFYKQMALAAGFDKVFAFVPAFRAEPSFTTRHLTEFTSWDFEIAYIDDQNDSMLEIENSLVAGFEMVKKEILPDLEIPTQPFPRLTMKEAKEKLAKAKVPSEKEHDVSPEEERQICKIIKEEIGHDFVFLTDWHKDARSFYHMRYENDPDITMGHDLLYKGVEILTGAQREHRIEYLEKQAKEKDIPLEPLADYLNFFRYGCPPHGGGAFGPARIIMRILELENINEATFLPRNVKRLTP